MLPGGWLIDRVGSAKALTLYALLMGSFVCLTGILGWAMLQPAGLLFGLLAIRSLAGVSSAPLHPGGRTCRVGTVRWTGENHRQRNCHRWCTHRHCDLLSDDGLADGSHHLATCRCSQRTYSVRVWVAVAFIYAKQS